MRLPAHKKQLQFAREMIVKINKFIFVFLFLFGYLSIQAQTASSSDNLLAQPISNRNVFFDVSDKGVSKPIIWGLDLAWLSEENIRRGIAFMGEERVDLIRSSFTPTAPLLDGELPAAELATLKKRLRIIDLLGSHTQIVLNCDHPSVDPWFNEDPANWAQLIDITTRHHQEAGRTVVTVSPFNEPDYGWGQGTVSDFYRIAGILKENPRFDDIRISGGNTLNPDVALSWYNQLKNHLDEGNTHQLAGSFDNYAKFYETVRANGHHATNDELHNVMEALVGVEYGLQTGIWWGTAELARGEFVKASDGVRLGYAEHRPNWTAAAVYRSPEGKTQAFGGTSERQATTTTYRFVSKDRDVYFDGQGPQREYTMTLPGGTGYSQGQTNAERVVNITWGEDIQPEINGRYVLVNRNSRKVMEVANKSTVAGADVRQANHILGETSQQWDVTPVDSRIGGDFSYFTITAAHSGKALDILNWSLEDGVNIIAWDDTKGANQQWYLEYEEDGWFYIRSRHSAKCLEIRGSSTAASALVQQRGKNGKANQQWRFLPVDAPIEFDSPSAPENLKATSNAESIRLDWAESPETDVSGYNVFRSDSSEGEYNTIARNVTSTSFVDNTTETGKTYYYKVKSADKSLNRSLCSNTVFAATTGEKGLLAHFAFENNLKDGTDNLNHAAHYGNISFVEGKTGTKAVALDGKTNFLQLPATLINKEEVTLAMWVYWKGGSTWQRIFDFGNGENENMFLTPRADSGKLRFAIKNGGAEQQLNASAFPTNKWIHLAVTLGKSGVRLYMNGSLEVESDAITIRPSDFKPLINYIGCSQYPDPLFQGNIDDFRVYNYALTADEIASVANADYNSITSPESAQNALYLWPLPAKDVLHVSYSGENNSAQSTVSIYNMSGRLLLTETVGNINDMQLDVSDLPEGFYLLKLNNREVSLTRKIIIKR